MSKARDLGDLTPGTAAKANLTDDPNDNTSGRALRTDDAYAAGSRNWHDGNLPEEEGDFALIVSSSGGGESISFGSTTQKYYRLGKKAEISIFAPIDSVSGGSGTININLPFSAEFLTPEVGVAINNPTTENVNDFYGRVTGDTLRIYLGNKISITANNNAFAQLQAGSEIRAYFSIITAA